MKLKEVYPGYSTYVDDKAAAEYRKAGATHIWHGVGSKDAVVAICQSDGLTASLHRTISGMKPCGASPDWDMKSGGADSVFVRLGTRNNRVEYTDCPLCGYYRIIIDRKELNRTDWYAHESDSYGRARLGSYDWKHRPSSLQFVEDMAHSYLYDNEIMLRHGIRKESFVGISCDFDTDRDDLIQAFKKAGMTQINGVDVEDFVQVHSTLEDDARRGVEGLKYYASP